MREEIRKYLSVLKQLIDLQQKLIQEFETVVEVVTLPSDYPDDYGGEKLKRIIRPEYSITEILRAWPEDADTISLVNWVRPRVGVLKLEGENWLYVIHGSWEVGFKGFPSELEKKVLSALREGEEDVWSKINRGPVIDVTYLDKGRTDGVRPWSVYWFVKSTTSEGTVPSEAKHKEMLEELVREGFLIRLPGSYYYRMGVV